MIKNTEPTKGEILIYQTSPNEPQIEIKIERETIWLTLNQIAELFDVDKSGVSRHIKNVFKSKELQKEATVANFATVQKEGGRLLNRTIEYYNLDAIVSVGYRINSKKGTQFRIWASQILKDHLVKGFTLNPKRLSQTGLGEFERALRLIKSTIDSKDLTAGEAKGILDVITSYANSWVLLQKYDEGSIGAPKKKTTPSFKLDYGIAKKAIKNLKEDLLDKQSATELFGAERDKMLEGVLGSIYQTFAKKEVYPSIEEKAAHLLYFIIKDHPFSDGNKRIGAFLFIYFLQENKYLYNQQSERKINDNALVALALLIAQSDPKEKEVMIKLVMHFLGNR
ncbi:MAG: Fic/DOC family protein [Parcubacteria group bacterium Gr01-1014_18]|nr:MAG: Fic/DOC family protein [Parcubacteria group bacterium Greene0416_36]TSC81436.1 MAG: Fic/DOC family protein [Parcubacteria group bacterium Gr01-1014_18]TSC99034.1 MAG: Fic/DOC family protein [Parcubacteria group bacterium Greene1014_20]TSD07285.1 MAG: Fic/DOC family protein [Parcubacteria group bacterium Greene0714_2]